MIVSTGLPYNDTESVLKSADFNTTYPIEECNSWQTRLRANDASATTELRLLPLSTGFSKICFTPRIQLESRVRYVHGFENKTQKHLDK
jgi:hypothetical protein